MPAALSDFLVQLGFASFTVLVFEDSRWQTF
jgi:hypothetical protein